MPKEYTLERGGETHLQLQRPYSVRWGRQEICIWGEDHLPVDIEFPVAQVKLHGDILERMKNATL